MKYYHCGKFFLWRESGEEGQGDFSLFLELCQYLTAVRGEGIFKEPETREELKKDMI